MRGRWVVAAAAVLALVVVGGVGGLTMRAFAGTAHTKVVTNTVTKFCVYVDRKNGGDSYGDVSVSPKYKNRICIVGKPGHAGHDGLAGPSGPAGPPGADGKQGPAGDSVVITWNKTVATAPAPPSAKRIRYGLTANFVDLAKVGPFTVRGYCGLGSPVQAYTDVLSAQNGSSFAWDDTVFPANFNNGDDRHASPSANGGPLAPSFVTEYDNGEFSASTGDQKIAFTGFAENGVYIQGPTGPACSFIGHLVVENP